MIRPDKLNRIVKHLNVYKNTIIVPNDFKHDKLENLIKAIEDEGFVVKSLQFRPNKRKDAYDHWLIEVM